jgi:hypothetical protein
MQSVSTSAKISFAQSESGNTFHACKHVLNAGCKHETALEISSYRKLPEIYWTTMLGIFVAI